MIDTYRRDPRPTSQPGQHTEGDLTFDSLPGGSSPRKRGARQSAKPAAPAGRGAAPAGRGSAAGRGAAGGASRRVLLGIGSAAAALALLAAGVVLGAYVATGRRAPTGQNSEASSKRPQSPPLVTGLPPDPGGKPVIAINQHMGDSSTIFLLQGRGWRPGSRVTIRLIVGGTSVKSPIRPMVDLAGTFNYAINQTHEFFAKGLPPGHYRVIVTGPGGRKETARFMVMPLRPPPPPGGGPAQPAPSPQ